MKAVRVCETRRMGGGRARERREEREEREEREGGLRSVSRE